MMQRIYAELGGPTHPVHTTEFTTSIDYGKSLLDEFAGQALQGYLASIGPHTEPVEVASTIADDCYKLAVAMLRAREKVIAELTGGAAC